MHSLFRRYARKFSCALVCAGAVVAAGCHHNDLDSGYGIAWVTLSETPGDFASYIVNVDSVSLTGVTYGVVTPVSSIETVDFTKLKDISELWSTASVPNDKYTAASIVVDYTGANISVMVNGVPQQAKVVDTTGAARDHANHQHHLRPAASADHPAHPGIVERAAPGHQLQSRRLERGEPGDQPGDRDDQAHHDRRHQLSPIRNPSGSAVR